MAYDGTGRRVSKDVKAEAGDWICEYHYYYNGQSMIETRNADSGAVEPSAHCQLPIASLLQRVVVGTDQPYGLCDVGHQGLMHDKEFGLVYNRARYFHPTLMRFMARDKEGYIDGMSLYEYQRSYPVGYVDPSGNILPRVGHPDSSGGYSGAGRRSRHIDASLDDSKHLSKLQEIRDISNVVSSIINKRDGTNANPYMKRVKDASEFYDRQSSSKDGNRELGLRVLKDSIDTVDRQMRVDAAAMYRAATTGPRKHATGHDAVLACVGEKLVLQMTTTISARRYPIVLEVRHFVRTLKSTTPKTIAYEIGIIEREMKAANHRWDAGSLEEHYLRADAAKWMTVAQILPGGSSYIAAKEGKYAQAAFWGALDGLLWAPVATSAVKGTVWVGRGGFKVASVAVKGAGMGLKLVVVGGKKTVAFLATTAVRLGKTSRVIWNAITGLGTAAGRQQVKLFVHRGFTNIIRGLGRIKSGAKGLGQKMRQLGRGKGATGSADDVFLHNRIGGGSQHYNPNSNLSSWSPKAQKAGKGIAEPTVTNQKLKNIVKELYKGTKSPNPIGTGSTADAIRNEIRTGLRTHGVWHSEKGRQFVRALEKWLKKQASASASDRTVARQLLADLQSALRGK